AVGGRLEDGLQACFAAAQSFFGVFVFVDVFEGAVPADGFAVFVAPRGGAGSHPPPFTVAAADAVLNVEKLAGAKGFFPRSERVLTVVGMKGANPSLSPRLVLRKAGEGFPAMAGVEDHSIGICGPGYFGTEFDGVAIVVFAFGEGLFGLFAAGDVDQRDGDADDLVRLVARGLIGDEKGAHEVRLMGVGTAGLEFAVALALE